MPHATVPSPGLQALILCGPGVSLNTFTANPKDLPKSLIPIANRPMVWYPLDLCYRMGIHVIKLITPPESEAALQIALKTHPALTSLPSPKPEVLAPAGLTQTTGTGELLRLPEVQKAIEKDFIVLPCDIITELDLNKLVHQWMILNPLSNSSHGSRNKGALAVFYPTRGLEGISNKKDETDFIGTVPLPSSPVPPPEGSLRPRIEELVTSMPTDTLNDKFEDNHDVLDLRAQLMQRYGQVKYKTKHRDAHIYIFPKWVKEFASRNERFDSISEDILGWWAKALWQPGLSGLLGLDEVLRPTEISSDDSDEPGALQEDHVPDPWSLSTTKMSVTTRAPPLSPFASRVGTSTSVKQPPVTIPPLHAYVQPTLPHNTTAPTISHPLIRRIDTSAALLNVSLYLAKQPLAPAHPLTHENKIHPTAKVGPQSRVSQEDSLIAENVAIGFRANIKESVIGVNCEIGNNVRLTRCLLMDSVTVGDGVTLTGCIIGRRARIEGQTPSPEPTASGQSGADGTSGKGKGKKKTKGNDDDADRTKLTDCEVAPNFVVEAGTEAKGEKMMPFDTEGDLEEFGGGDAHDDDEDDDDDDEEEEEEDDDDENDDNESASEDEDEDD